VLEVKALRPQSVAGDVGSGLGDGVDEGPPEPLEEQAISSKAQRTIARAEMTRMTV
jgi:hypothetical protein